MVPVAGFLKAYSRTHFVSARDPPVNGKEEKTTPGELNSKHSFPYLQLFIGDLSRIIANWENIIADFGVLLLFLSDGQNLRRETPPVEWQREGRGSFVHDMIVSQVSSIKPGGR